MVAQTSLSRDERRARAAQRNLLNDIVRRAHHIPETGSPPVVVFDLDGTLMDNRPRSCAILHEIGGIWETQHPEVAARVRAAKPDSLAYLVRDSLSHLGVTTDELIAEAEAYWRARFFRDEHLVHDTAIAGAVDFARDCYAAGASLVYLTGRDLPQMGLGTFRSLRDLGFPIGVAGTEVILKPRADMPDELFKRQVAPDLRRIGYVIAAFDNEPGNCNAFLEYYPECTSVLIDTQHMPGAPPLAPGVHVALDFLR
jgi:hypothetical protein